MEHLTSPLPFLSFLTVAVSCFLSPRAAASPQQPQLSRSLHSKVSNFVLHSHAVLNASSILSAMEDRPGSCAFACLRNSQCFSYNEAVSPDSNNKYQCQLLAGDKYSSSSAFKPSHEFNHYSIQSPCGSFPCQNRGTCVPSYETGEYKCSCSMATFGSHCQYIKQNSCQAFKQAYPDFLDGVYQLNHTGNPGNDFPAYCDMRSFGGGWTMCYTTNNLVDPKDETTYDENVPYGTNGYRTNCNDIEFNEIMFVDEETGQKEYFRRDSGQKLTAIDSYNKGGSEHGLWTASGTLAPTSNSYQLTVCDMSFYSGFMVSGVVGGYKVCDNWRGDQSSMYFRTSSTNPYYGGVAFNVHGHRTVPNRLISVALRYKA